MKVLCVVGMPGSGKSRAMEFLRRKGVSIVSMGDVVREAAQAEGLPITPENLGRVSSDLRRKHGREVVARRCLEKIEKIRREKGGGDLLVIEGIRSREEVLFFQENYEGEFRVLALHASPDRRFERLSRRGREDDPTCREEFEERDERELGFGMARVIALADYLIVNEGSEEELEREMEILYRDLTSS
jgi:dephospho-CoA kinase